MYTHPIVQVSDRKPAFFSVRRSVYIALAVALCVSYFAFSSPTPTRAASLSPVGWTNSYYLDSAMTNMNGGNLQTTFSQWGTSEASSDNAVASAHGACSSGQYPMYVIIDFGQAFSSYIYTFAGTNLSWSQAKSIALAYATGWYNASNNCFRLHLSIGVNNQVCGNWSSTNNSDPCVQASGNVLAQTVEGANSSLASAGDSWQADVSGAVDAESDPGFGSYSTTLGFVNAYNATIGSYATAYQLYDFGDATHSCNLDWSCDPTSRVYNIAWSIGYDYPFPEAYSTGQNSNWLEVSRYSSSNPIRYRVVLLDASQGNGANSSEWQDFVNKNGSWVESGILAGSAQLPLG